MKKYWSISGIYIILIIIPVIILFGCNSGSPVTPDKQDTLNPAPITQEVQTSTGSGRVMLGLYDITIQKSTGDIEIVPLRESSWHLNIIPFLEPPILSGFNVDFGTLVLDFPNNHMIVDLIITHPLPGMDQYSLFDVRGIMIFPGTSIPYSDINLVFSGGDEPKMLNPDGYTRWWNPKEFPGTNLLGFHAGMLGQPGGPGVFTANINGYKYYADGLGPETPLSELDPDNRGVFRSGSSLSRRFDVSFGKNQSDFLKLQYAIDAMWTEPYTMVNPNVPDDFPAEANAPEGYRIETTEMENDMWWLDNVGMGGHLLLNVDVYTWRPDAIDRVFFESSEIISSPVEGTVIEGSGGGPDDPVFLTYSFDIHPDALTSDGVKPCLITVEAAESYTQDGICPFFGPLDSKVSLYKPFETNVSFVPDMEWKVKNVVILPMQPTTTVKEMSVVAGTSREGVYFFGNDYGLFRYPLDYSGKPTHVSTMAGYFGYTDYELYGESQEIGRFEVSPFGHFVASTITGDLSPTWAGGLKRDYAFVFNDFWSPTGQLPVQVAIPNPDMGYFKFVDAASNWANDLFNTKVYWIQVDDPDEATAPDPDISVILGVYQYSFSGNPFSKDVDYITGTLAPQGIGDGLVDVSCLDRLAVDSDPQGVGGSTDLICWLMETSPPAIECFSVVSSDSSGNLNQPLTTLHNFHGTPRDIAVLPTHAGGYGVYNWVVVLEEGTGTWSIECFDQTGALWYGIYDLSGYPACMDINPVNYNIHVWFSAGVGTDIIAAVFSLEIQ
ncbi:MAG: hypothetical protein NTY09_02670 [bacterium]|nr:hypothetical protein [bacterium]